jgi:hypothetical protein
MTNQDKTHQDTPRLKNGWQDMTNQSRNHSFWCVNLYCKCLRCKKYFLANCKHRIN